MYEAFFYSWKTFFNFIWQIKDRAYFPNKILNKRNFDGDSLVTIAYS